MFRNKSKYLRLNEDLRFWPNSKLASIPSTLSVPPLSVCSNGKTATLMASSKQVRWSVNELSKHQVVDLHQCRLITRKQKAQWQNGGVTLHLVKW